MSLILFQEIGGNVIYINPDQVVYVKERSDDESEIHTVNRGYVLVGQSAARVAARLQGKPFPPGMTAFPDNPSVQVEPL